MNLHAVLTQVEGHIRGVEEVVGEELLDDVSLVPAADDEVGDSVRSVGLADVPQQGSPADLDHRLGPGHRFLGQPGSPASGEDYRLHRDVSEQVGRGLSGLSGAALDIDSL